MESSEYLFDVRPYSARRNTRVLPLKRPARSAIDPQVWRALVRVKIAIETKAARDSSRRS